MGCLGWWKKNVGLAAVAGLAMTTVACGGAHGQAKEPMGHVEVQQLESPDDAPENAKTVQVSYVFDRDVVNNDYEKAFSDQFDKKGIHVDEQLNAKAHLDLKGVKITGTVTYVKRRMGYSIIEADLVTEGHYDADVQVDLDVKVKAETPKQAAPTSGTKGLSPKKKGLFGFGGGVKEGLIPTEAKLEESDFDGTALGGKPFTIVKNVMPTNIPIAGPLFLHAHFDLTAACDIGVEGQMHATTGVGIKGDVRLVAKYKKAGFEKADGKKSKFAFEAKTPNFELAPRPYLKVEGKQQAIKGRCSVQPTAVLLLEHSVGAKLMVEPWVEMDASRPNTRTAWKLGTQAGVSVNAATDIELFGRQMRKPKEFNLFEVAFGKPSDGQPTAPTTPLAPSAPLAPPAAAVAVVTPPAVKPEPVVAALTEERKAEPVKTEPAKTETVALKTDEPAAPTTKASMPAALRTSTEKTEKDEDTKPEARVADTTEPPTKGRKKSSKPAAAVNAADIMASATGSEAPASRDDDADTSAASTKKKLPSKKLANIGAGASKAGAIASAATKLLKKKR